MPLNPRPRQYDRAMPGDTYVVARGEFSIEEPWALPSSVEPVALRRATDGAEPRLATTVAAYYDDEFLTVVFSAVDDHVVATMYGHDEPLYNEDVVEVFLAPCARSEYFEIEVNPVGTTFDARIESPDLNRATMSADLSWDCEGLIAAVRKVWSDTDSMMIDTLLRIPFACVSRSAPRDAEEWTANFFRVDRHPQFGDEYSAWCPTMKQPADFHVPPSFGRLLFRR